MEKTEKRTDSQRKTKKLLQAILILSGAAVLFFAPTNRQRESLRVQDESFLETPEEVPEDVVVPPSKQLSLTVKGPSHDGKWSYTVHYSTNSSLARPMTRCWAWKSSTSTPKTEENAHVVGFGGHATTYSNLQVNGVYTNPDDFYTSPYLHRCQLPGLSPETSYVYRIDSVSDEAEFSFVTPPLPHSEKQITLAVMADVGQTQFSNATFASAKKLWKKHAFSTLLLPGDLSYSDGDQHRWDSFANLATQLLANVELISSAGNHEVEHQEAFVGYTARYAPGPLWHVARRGPVTIITLNSYSRFEEGSAQYRWLVQTLQDVDRSVTPWLIVQFHVPIYNSNQAHQQEGARFKAVVEPLFQKYKVDLLFSGHVHAYERTLPVFEDKVNECGTIQIVIGDGGNREGPSSSWLSQPDWSSFRESTFGFGYLTIDSPTKARWTWVRNPYPSYASSFDDESISIHQDKNHDTIAIDRSSCPSRLT